MTKIENVSRIYDLSFVNCCTEDYDQSSSKGLYLYEGELIDNDELKDLPELR